MQSHMWRSLFAVMVVGVSGAAQAALIDRGGGLIYDDVLNITWLQDANFAQTSGYDADGLMTLDAAITWAADLSYYDSVRGVTYDDWRLPTLTPFDGVRFDLSGSYDGSTDVGYNITGTNNEISYMFYVNLGNTGNYDTNGVLNGCYMSVADTCLDNVGPFVNLQADYYWQDTDFPTGSSATWHFLFHEGVQHYDYNAESIYAWAVRPGDVASSVPVPPAVWLFASGLLGLVGVARRKAD